mmetsp:Transcript_41159/g.94672  ORF Transcript_41159/g.94672 Transcript_41159/m.94672 type:complete len:327 (-) Transcript_41159:211-1191(-)
MIGDPVEYRGSGVAHIRLYGGMMVPKEPLGVPVRPHFRKKPDPDYEWYCHHKTQGPWALWQKDMSPPFSHYPESSCVKKYVRPGDDHSRRVFAELVKQGHGFQDCTVVRADGVRSSGDERLQRTVRQRYSQIMRRPTFMPGMRPHSAPSTSRASYHGNAYVQGGVFEGAAVAKQHSKGPENTRPKRDSGQAVLKKAIEAAMEAASPQRKHGKAKAARSKQVAADPAADDAVKLARTKALAAARKVGIDAPQTHRPASAPGPGGARAVSLWARRPLQAGSQQQVGGSSAADPLLESSRGSRPRKPKENSSHRSTSAPGRAAAAAARR